jgi:methyl-galactoside transport system substrate-binding protein
MALAALALILPACSDQGKARPRIGLAMRSFDDPASSALRRAAETDALDKAELSVIDGQNQASSQAMQVDALFQGKLAALAIDPPEGANLAPLIAKAKAKVTPVVFFGRRPEDAIMRSWDKLYFVGSRPADAGAAEAEILASYWKSAPAADKSRDGRLQYAVLDAERGLSEEAARLEGFAKALGAAGVKAERLAPAATPGKAGSAKERAAALLAKYGDKLEALVCGDAASALEAVEGLKAAGYFAGKKYLPLVASREGELSPQAAEAISAGSLLGVACVDPAAQGRAVFRLSYALARRLDPVLSGLAVADAKYLWVAYRKAVKGSISAPSK